MMNFFRRKKPEQRESSLTDALVAQIVAGASGATLALPTTTGALETCAGLVGRAFASAEVNGPVWTQRALTPDTLTLIGRELIRCGEVVLLIDGGTDGLVLRPVADFDVTGSYNPESWVYRVNLAGPSELRTRTVNAEGVVHVRYAVDPTRPWHGVGPIQAATLAGRLSAETVQALADEASGPRGSFLPIPHTDGEDQTVTDLKADIAKLKGSTAVVEGMGTGWEAGGAGRMADWQTRRIGATPPDSLIMLMMEARKEILSACGIPPTLFDRSSDASAREAWRMCLHATIAPLGGIVAAELTAKLDASVVLDWTELRASDLAGRARAFQSMVGAGMEMERAAAISGLMVAEGEQ